MAAETTQHNTRGALPDDAWITQGPPITTLRPHARGMLPGIAFSEPVRRGARQAHPARRSDSKYTQTGAQLNTDQRPLAHPQEDAQQTGATSNATSVSVCTQPEQTRGRREPQRRRGASSEKGKHDKVAGWTSPAGHRTCLPLRSGGTARLSDGVIISSSTLPGAP